MGAESSLLNENESAHKSVLVESGLKRREKDHLQRAYSIKQHQSGRYQLHRIITNIVGGFVVSLN